VLFFIRRGLGELLSLGEEPDRHTGGSARLRGLQDEFDAADANDDNQRGKRGSQGRFSNRAPHNLLRRRYMLRTGRNLVR
jgi:hypothetical protein